MNSEVSRYGYDHWLSLTISYISHTDITNQDLHKLNYKHTSTLTLTASCFSYSLTATSRNLRSTPHTQSPIHINQMPCQMINHTNKMPCQKTNHTHARPASGTLTTAKAAIHDMCMCWATNSLTEPERSG